MPGRPAGVGRSRSCLRAATTRQGGNGKIGSIGLLAPLFVRDADPALERQPVFARRGICELD